MDLTKIQLEYKSLESEYDEVRAIRFVRDLTRTNDKYIIDFHYKILKNTESKLFYSVRGNFDKHGIDGKNFLLEKLNSETDTDLKAEALFILGAMDDLESTEENVIKSIAKEFISNNENYRDQYYGIIILGWLGKKEEVVFLDKEMKENNNKQLRGFAATALRQIWYNNTRLNKSILKCYFNSLLSETEYVVNSSIIACVQDFLQRKLGIKENMRGEISGDVETAKPKALKAIANFLKTQ